MSDSSMIGCLTLSSLLVLSLIAGTALAQSPDTEPKAEPALAIDPGNDQLAWGPCPPFMPEGCAIAVLHGDPAKPNLDIFFKVPGKSVIPLHRHTSAERMILVSGELHVSYEGQPQAVLKPGNYAYGPAQRPHHGRCASDEPCVLFIAFESPLDAEPIAVAAE